MTYAFSRPRHLKERNAPKMAKAFHLRKNLTNHDQLKLVVAFEFKRTTKKAG